MITSPIRNLMECYVFCEKVLLSKFVAILGQNSPKDLVKLVYRPADKASFDADMLCLQTFMILANQAQS